MECLVTKLKGTVNDSTLLGLNELRLTLHYEDGFASNALKLRVANSAIIKALGGKMISLSNGSGYSPSVEIPANVFTPIYFQEGDTEISIPNKYDLQRIQNEVENGIYLKNLDIDSLKYCKNLSTINSIVDSGIHGNIESLSNTPLTMLVLINNNAEAGKIRGDISVLDNIPTKNIQDVFSGVTGELKKITKYLVLFMASEENDASLNVISESDVDAECSNVQVKMNVRNLNLNWLSKCHAIKSLGNLFSDTDKDVNVSGNVCTLAKDLNIAGSIFIKNAKGTDVQTLSDLPNSVYFLTQANRLGNKSLLLPLSWNGNTSGRTDLLALENVHFKTGTAQFIKDMSKCNNSHTSQNYYQAISIALADDLTQSAAQEDSELQDAISTLQGKGVTVSMVYSDTATNSISLMSAKEASKYGIVYKGKELIVEPTDTSKELIAPANDCLYQEFDTYEEAQAYVDANGLEYRQSE